MLRNQSRIVAFEKVKGAQLSLQMEDFIDNLDQLPIKTALYNWLRNAKAVQDIEEKKKQEISKKQAEE